MKMLYSMLVGATLLTASCANAQSSDMNENPVGQISVSATGQSYQVPDTATVSAGVVTQASTASGAMSANAAQMNRTIDELLKAGIEKRHIQTSQLSLQPRYDYSNRQAPKITGYEARNTVSAKSENIDKVGAMLDALVTAGANNINGVSFSIKDPEDAQSEARKEAVKKARKKAEEMANAAGVGLGRIMQISEGGGGFSPPQPMMMRAAAMDTAESTPVAAGEQTLSVTVNMTFAIKQ